MDKLKVRYDKHLNKYHIEYEKLKNKDDYRYTYLKGISDISDMFVIIETHLGSVNEPDPTDYTRELERHLHENGLTFSVRPIEVRMQKSIFGILSMGSKDKIKDYSIGFMIPKGGLTRELFDLLLCEYDVHIGYKALKSKDTIFDDIEKGYFNSEDMSSYFEQTLFDSRIFEKFLATEDRNPKK